MSDEPTNSTRTVSPRPEATTAPEICFCCAKSQSEDGNKLLFCSTCRKAGFPVTYCSRSCQAADWRICHKNMCGKMRQLPRSFSKNIEVPAAAFEKVQVKEFNTRGTAHYPDNMMVFTLLPPPPPIDVDLKTIDLATFIKIGLEYPRVTATFCSSTMKKHILSLPGFPQSVPKLIKPLQEIRAAGAKGKGMFATVDIARGQSIFFERPLMLTVMPTILGVPGVLGVPDTLQYSDQQRARIMCSHAEQCCQMMVSCMEPEAKEAYMSLENIHPSEEGQYFGIFRTNGLSTDLRDPDLNDILVGKNELVGVCEHLSRINHSCLPNAEWEFEPLSFSFRLSASQSIKKGEEICISYISLNARYEVRKKLLVGYGFACSCPRCVAESGGYKGKAKAK